MVFVIGRGFTSTGTLFTYQTLDSSEAHYANNVEGATQ